ncbi:MAG TPA: PAS domain-containing protein [Anaerolineaceae bacterium]|nr:PAS domain-containing protein [Anaerolineaceae bacterium]
MENQNIFYDLTGIETSINSSNIFGSLLFHFHFDAILISHRLSGRILDASRTAESIYGYSRNDLLCRSMADLQVGSDEHNPGAAFQPTSPSSTSTSALHHKKDGTIFPVELISVQIETNEAPITMMFIQEF